MAPLLFITPCLLRISKKSSQTCVCRPRAFACASNSEEQPREIGDSTWINFARDISPTDSDDIPRPPPKWEYPEGDPSVPDDDNQNPWKRWNAAIENDSPLEQRDIKAETDFWRSAARELSDEKDDSSNTPSGQTVAARPDDILTDEPPISEDVWRMARGVTGDMTEMQEKLRSELERYNPDENTEQYRNIARELVGPTEEPWENSDPIRRSQSEAQSGSGWNPDVDWMRFDDVRREQAKEAEKSARLEAERVAKEQMETVRNESQESFAGVDDARERGFTSIDDELTRTFTDQSVDESFIRDTPIEKLPGFLTNRLRTSGTYGSGWSGADEEARKLQEQGVPLRDPQADADKWRGVARELNLEVEAGSEEVSPNDIEQQELSSSVKADVEEEADDVAKELEKVTLETESADRVDLSSNVSEESPWSSWRSSSANWEAANEKAGVRDPAKEVDMWRSSARELISTTPVSEESTSSGESEVSGTDKTPKNEGNAWDQWRAANAKWESSISSTSEEARRESKKKWGNNDRSDWGAGMGGEATSERSVWEQWNNVSGMSTQSGSNLWWNTRTDFSFEDEPKPDRSFNNADEWRSVARETLNLPKKQADTAPKSREERIEKDSTLDSWRSIAKDLIEDHD